MNDAPFLEGWLVYGAEAVSAPDLERLMAEAWRDGYFAFSRGQLRLADARPHAINDWLTDRVVGLEGVEGYLMELDLWRTTPSGVMEEVVWEREDHGFWVQRFALTSHPLIQGNANCWYRPATTLPLANSLFVQSRGEAPLASVEVILKEKRLHFFITTGEM
jgi:hypothetical protein